MRRISVCVMFKPRQGFIAILLCVCLCVPLLTKYLNKISGSGPLTENVGSGAQKVFSQLTSVLVGAYSLTQIRNDLISSKVPLG